jgi:hypothetical protein
VVVCQRGVDGPNELLPPDPVWILEDVVTLGAERKWEGLYGVHRTPSVSLVVGGVYSVAPPLIWSQRAQIRVDGRAPPYTETVAFEISGSPSSLSRSAGIPNRSNATRPSSFSCDLVEYKDT